MNLSSPFCSSPLLPLPLTFCLVIIKSFNTFTSLSSNLFNTHVIPTKSSHMTFFPTQYLQRGGSRLAEQQRRLKSQIWSSVVTIVLVEGKELLPMDPDGTSDPYVKFRWGCEWPLWYISFLHLLLFFNLYSLIILHLFF